MHEEAGEQGVSSKASAAGGKRFSHHPSSLAPHPATILAFDFGARRIGVAVGDSETGTANALVLVCAASFAGRMEKIEALVREWRPQRLVVGLPVTLAGAESETSRDARRFARRLAARFALPVDLADERLSSAAAEERLRECGRGGQKHKDLVHAEAARIFLQSYLDEQHASRR
ncbi:MAG: Holliday junction resolvase RuvX [Betaproteobacteria bacterium]|nr:Holliday junction resolvase RuvX [Betaproteobacteria bacterium]